MRSLSYRNQPNDLLCKSMDWFLYGRNLRRKRIKLFASSPNLCNKFKSNFFFHTTLQYLRKAFTTFWKGSSRNFASIIELPCPDPRQREKNNSNISFMKYCEILNISKGFTKALKAYIKPFQVSQRSVKPNLISILKQLSEIHGAWRVKGS